MPASWPSYTQILKDKSWLSDCLMIAFWLLCGIVLQTEVLLLLLAITCSNRRTEWSWRWQEQYQKYFKTWRTGLCRHALSMPPHRYPLSIIHRAWYDVHMLLMLCYLAVGGIFRRQIISLPLVRAPSAVIEKLEYKDTPSAATPGGTTLRRRKHSRQRDPLEL